MCGSRGQTATRAASHRQRPQERLVSWGGLQNSPWGRAHSTLSVGAGAVSPLLLAASMAVFRSCIHFSFSSRELWAGAEAQLPGRAHGRGCLSWPLSQGKQVGGHYPLCTQPAPLKLERGAKSPLLR